MQIQDTQMPDVSSGASMASEPPRSFRRVMGQTARGGIDWRHGEGWL